MVAHPIFMPPMAVRDLFLELIPTPPGAQAPRDLEMFAPEGLPPVWATAGPASTVSRPLRPSRASPP